MGAALGKVRFEVRVGGAYFEVVGEGAAPNMVMLQGSWWCFGFFVHGNG